LRLRRLDRQRGILRRQFERRLSVVQAARLAVEGCDALFEPGLLAKQGLRLRLVVPEAGLGRDRVDLRDALQVAIDVKAAPGGTGVACGVRSVRAGSRRS